MADRVVLAIDPGSERSAWLRFANGRPVAFGKQDNDLILASLRAKLWRLDGPIDVVVIEWTAPRGMPASAQLFETLWWTGRFAEACQPTRVERLPRADVKRHLCGTTAASDSNVIAALIDRFGGIGGKRAAVGVKAAPGPLYGIHHDLWQALALAVAFSDITSAR